MSCSYKTEHLLMKKKIAGDIKKNHLARSIARACMGTSLLMTPTLPVFAQTSTEVDSNNPNREEIIVTGDKGDFTRNNSSIGKFTESLRDTPQSITSLSSEFLDQRGVVSLEEALRTVPGITMGAGEFSWQGNNPSLRGFSSRNDMFLDGIRDFGSYSRDPFNLETVEVLQGPSSMVFGRGSTGGVINQASKKPLLDPMTTIKFNVGSDATLRGAADISRPVEAMGEGTAFRLNLMGHKSEVADRDGAEANRYGIAPTLAFGLGSPTQLTLSYMKQVADDTPDYGLPWFDGRPAPVPRNNFYGFDSDYLKTDADIFTAEGVHEVNENIVLNSQIRYAHYTRESRITEPLIDAFVPSGTPPGDITIDRYVFMGESVETMLFGQASATLRFSTGQIDHAVVTGVEIGRETSDPTFGFSLGVPGTNLLNPDQGSGFSATSQETRLISDTVSKSHAVYALDTMKYGESWQLITGIRWDRFKTDYNETRLPGTPTRFAGAGTNSNSSIVGLDKEASYRAALVYKPAEAGNIYFAWGNSFNPSSEGLSFVSSGRGLGTSNAFLEPEKNSSYEIGAKWDLFDAKMVLNGAAFRVTKSNARVSDPSNPGFNILEGKQRVDGISMTISGYINENLELWGGYTYLDGQVVSSNRPMVDVPEHSLSTWATYRISERLQLGGGARYLSGRLANNNPPEKSVPGYWAFDAMGSYQLSEKFLLKLNLSNLTDKEYFSQTHSWHVVPGPGMTATFAVNMFY